MTTVGINARTFSVAQPGGAVQVAMRLTRELVANPELNVVLFGHESLDESFPETPVVSAYLPSRSQVYGIAWERSVLPRLVSRHNVDVLLCPNGNAPISSIACPVVTYIHDVNAQKGMSSGIHQTYRKTMLPLGVRASDAVVTVSEFSKSEIVETLPATPSKVRVVYNGVDEFYLDDAESEPMDLPEPYILYVGAMNPRKNVAGLVKAYQLLRAERDCEHTLVLIGPENKRIYKQMDIDASDDCLVTPGFVPQPQLKDAYERADVFAYPSTYEGFGLPPLEAMACGTPVVAADSSSLPEVLGTAAELVDPDDTVSIADGIEGLIHDERRRGECIEAGRRQAASFTWERAGTDLYDVLRSVVG